MMLGRTVLYRCRPGQKERGQVDFAAFVTRENADGTLDLRIFRPGMSGVDDWNYTKVAPMASGYVSHCWHPVEEDEPKAEVKRGPGRPSKAAA